MSPAVGREPWRKKLFPAAHRHIAASCEGSFLEKLSEDYLRELATDQLRAEGLPLDDMEASFVEPAITRVLIEMKLGFLALEDEARARAATPKRGRPRRDFATMMVLAAAFHVAKDHGPRRKSDREAARVASARFGFAATVDQIRAAGRQFVWALCVVNRSFGPTVMDSIVGVLVEVMGTLSKLEDQLAAEQKLARPSRLFRPSGQEQGRGL